MKWFEEVYKTHFNDVYKYILVMTSDKAIAEELTQDVFTVLYRKQGKLLAHPYIRGWLYTTARNISWDFMKKKNRRRKLEIKLSTEALEKTYHTDTVPQDIYEILTDFLTDKEIELIRLNKEYGFTTKEISERKSVNFSALSQRIYRIKKKIKQTLNILLIMSGGIIK